MRAVISKFHRAHKGIHLIERERRKQGIPRGLESIGKTRFLTVYRGAMSVERCTEPIRYIVMNEELEGCEVTLMLRFWGEARLTLIRNSKITFKDVTARRLFTSTRY